MKSEINQPKITRLRPACVEAQMPETVEELIGVFDLTSSLARRGEKVVLTWLLAGSCGRFERYGTYSTYKLNDKASKHSGAINKTPFAVFAATAEGNPEIRDGRLKSRKTVEMNRDVERVLYIDQNWTSWVDVCNAFPQNID